MFGRPRSTLRTAAVCGFLLLAFSVFAWGLHAKLSLYKRDVVPSTATVAKLIIPQRTEHTLLGAPQTSDRNQTKGVWLLSLSFLAAILSLPSLNLRRRVPVPLTFGQQTASFPHYRFSRPPPSRPRAR